MPLEITYWTGRREARNASPLAAVSSEQRTLSGTSAQSGATPDRAEFVSIVATENARFAYGADPTASSSSAYIMAGERLWLTAEARNKIAGITA